MSYTIYKKEGFVKVNYKPETKVIYVLWKSLFDQNVIRECCEFQLKQVQKGARFIVVDISKTKGVVLEETQKWFENYLFPGYAKAGLCAIVTINSNAPITQLSAQRWTKIGSGFSFDVLIVKSKEDAANTIAAYLIS